MCATCRDTSKLTKPCHAASLAYGVSHALTNASIYRTFNLRDRDATTQTARFGGAHDCRRTGGPQAR